MVASHTCTNSHTHTLTLCSLTEQERERERERPDLAGSVLETERHSSMETVRTLAAAAAASCRVSCSCCAVHTGARHQRIPVNMQQQCIAPIHTRMHIHTCTCVHMRKRKSWVVQQKSKQLADVDSDVSVSVAPALSRPRKSCTRAFYPLSLARAFVLFSLFSQRIYLSLTRTQTYIPAAAAAHSPKLFEG